MTVLLAKVHPIMAFVGVVWFLIALALILIVLIQKGKGGGLASAFGGAGGAGGLLGTKTGDFLTGVTITMVIAFLVLSVVMVKFYRPEKAKGLESDQMTGNTATTTTDTGAVSTGDIENAADKIAETTTQAGQEAAGTVEEAADSVMQTATEAVETAGKEAENEVQQ